MCQVVINQQMCEPKKGHLNKTFKCIEMRHHSYLVFSFSEKKKKKTHKKLNNDKNKVAKVSIIMILSNIS